MKSKYAFLLMCAIVAISCNKALDMAPDGKLTMDEIFTDNNKVAAFLNSCYANVPSKGLGYFFTSRGPVNLSDDAWDTDAEAEPTLISGRMYNGDAAPGAHPVDNPASIDQNNGNYWNRYWNSIGNLNLFLSRIDTATVNDPAQRSRWKGEAQLLRAFYYTELLLWYGPSVPIEKAPHKFTDDFSNLKKATYYEVAKFIMEDCDAALATPEIPWRITVDAEAGRFTKALAAAIKSRMMLFAASPLYNNGQNHWDEAYNVTKQALASLRANGYELYNKVNLPHLYLVPDAYLGPNLNPHTALYNEYFTQPMKHQDNPIDKETIYQHRSNTGNIYHVDGVGAQNGYKSGTCPTQELVDAYETSDGKPVLNLDNPYLDEKHTQPNYNPDNTLYDAANPYANRDPRFYATIYYNGSKRKARWGFAETAASPENYPAGIGNRTRIITTYVGEPFTGIHASVRSATRTGYYERKFLYPTSGDDNGVAGAPHKWYRLGEMVLNFAEAAAEAGKLDEARTAVNEIRARAGMPDLPASLSKTQLITRIRNERRVELALEENRYFDVRRWAAPGGDLAKTDKWVTAMEITRNDNGTYTYKRRPVREVERKNYTTKFLYLPLPLDEANRLRSITGQNWQNPGW